MRTGRDLAIDTIFLFAYLVAQHPRVSGLFIHEWVSMGLLVLAMIHLILHWDWTVDALGRFFGRLCALPRWNLVIDTAIFAAFMIVTVSGLMVSRHVLFSCGLYAPGYFVWKPVHAISAEVLFSLVLVHIVIHWRWIFFAIKKNWMGIF